MHEEDFISDSESKKELILQIAIFVGLGIFGYFIAHNVYKACTWEVQSFFVGIFSEVSDFFSTIFRGERTYTTEIELSWWVLLFCGACYLVVYSSFKTCSLISKLFESFKLDLSFFRKRTEVAAQILADYSSYQDFKRRFKDFDKLSENAKREVKKLFEVE